MHVVIENLHHVHARGRVHAVRGASLHARGGEVVGLLGPNGAGKSTLLACVLGFLRPSAGSVRLGGVEPGDLRATSRLGWLSEAPRFPHGLTLAQVVEWHLGLLRAPRPHGPSARAALAGVGLAAWADWLPSRASHGMRQRLGLACALLHDPSLLVLDEPATGLDPGGIALLRDRIREARQRGATVLLSSHQLDEVERTCDRIVFMRAGELVAEEALASATAGARVMRLRLRTPSGALPPDEALAGLAAASGTRWLGTERDASRFEVDDDAGTTRLARAAENAGLLIGEIAPEQSRLERLFLEVARP